jgi:hypothetical protein
MVDLFRLLFASESILPDHRRASDGANAHLLRGTLYIVHDRFYLFAVQRNAELGAQSFGRLGLRGLDAAMRRHDHGYNYAMSKFRPCGRGAPHEGSYRIAEQCRICWLYFNDGRDPVAAGFRALYDGFPPDALHGANVPPAGRHAPPAMPSLGRRILNWAEDTARWEAAGRPEVDDAEAARRKAICLTNECGAYDEKRDTCLACGCPLHRTLFGDKIRRATSECPKGFWKAIT